MAQVLVEIIDGNNRRSSLILGGLEIPTRVTVALEYSESNREKMKKFEHLVKQNYREPVDRKFEDATKHILKTICSESDSDITSSEDEDIHEFCKDVED